MTSIFPNRTTTSTGMEAEKNIFPGMILYCGLFTYSPLGFPGGSLSLKEMFSCLYFSFVNAGFEEKYCNRKTPTFLQSSF